MKICVRLSPKVFAIGTVALTILLCLYYASYVSDVGEGSSGSTREQRRTQEVHAEARISDQSWGSSRRHATGADADIDTLEVFSEFDFQVRQISKPGGGNFPSFLGKEI